MCLDMDILRERERVKNYTLWDLPTWAPCTGVRFYSYIAFMLFRFKSLMKPFYFAIFESYDVIMFFNCFEDGNKHVKQK